MFIYELRYIFDFVRNFVGITVQINFTFYFSRRLDIDFIFGVGWCFMSYRLDVNCRMCCHMRICSRFFDSKDFTKTTPLNWLRSRRYYERFFGAFSTSHLMLLLFFSKFKWKPLLCLFRWSESIIALHSKHLILNRFVLLDFLTSIISFKLSKRQIHPLSLGRKTTFVGN